MPENKTEYQLEREFMDSTGITGEHIIKDASGQDVGFTIMDLLCIFKVYLNDRPINVKTISNDAIKAKSVEIEKQMYTESSGSYEDHGYCSNELEKACFRMAKWMQEQLKNK